MTRNTTTGLKFEDKVKVNLKGIDLTKHKLYKFLEEKGISWKDIVSKKILPDECYLVNDTLYVFEKKYQETKGSADEKPQTCGFKIMQFKKIAKALKISKVFYTYIFNDWFKKPEYKDMLEYIRSIPGCNYQFEEDYDGN